MKFTLSLLLVCLSTGVLANPRCSNIPDPTEEIIEGTGFDPEERFTYYRHVNTSEERLKDAKVLDYNAQPRLVTSKKLTYGGALGDKCKMAIQFALFDYTVELPNNEVCEDTLVEVIDY